MAVFITPRYSQACPVSLFSHELRPPLKGNRSGLQLFVLNGKKPNTWSRIPFQIDPINDEGRLEFFEDDSWKTKNLGEYDRIVFLAENFGRRRALSDDFPCQGSAVYEIRDGTKSGRYSYLTNCPLSQDFSKLPQKIKPESPVAYDSKKGSLTSDHYRYQFSKKNQLLFTRIDIGKGERKVKIAENSDITIRVDIKNFFNFNFTSDDIESYLEDVRVGEIGTNARLSFYLKIFYLFTIKLKLNTDVSFYKDSANIPMVIHIPVDSAKNLNSPSGIIYSWEYNSTSTKIDLGKNLQILSSENVKTVESGSDKLAALGEKTCQGSSTCRYRLGMSPGEDGFFMDFKINKSMVKKGFFPLFTSDVGEYNDRLNWDLDLDKNEKSKRAGIYFESSGLSKGSYPWDFWLRLGNESEQTYNCPRPVYVRKIKKNKRKKKSWNKRWKK